MTTIPEKKGPKVRMKGFGPEPKFYKSPMSADEIISGCLPPTRPGGLINRPGYYAGRAPGDLSGRHLETLHAFILAEIGAKQAARFTLMVWAQKDMSACAFLMEFNRLIDNGFSVNPAKGIYLVNSAHSKSDEHPAAADARGHVLGAIFGTFGAGRMSPEDMEAASWPIKADFLRAHQGELPDDAEIAPPYDAINEFTGICCRRYGSHGGTRTH